MGTRSANDSAVRIFQAFLRQRTWSQAELAREVGIQSARLKKLLETMERDGVLPLEREEDHPHVYWSLPKDWFPGGVLYQGKEVDALLRLLARVPKSRGRDRLLAIAGECLRGGRDLAAALTEIVRPAEPSVTETQQLDLVERSAADRVTLYARYYSTRGSEAWRHMSVHRVAPGPPARFVAVCHRSGELRWFRVENVLAAELDPKEPFRSADAAAVEALITTSLDGFADKGPARELSFRVRDPEARWVGKNLIPGMKPEPEPRGGIRVRISTSAVSIVARYVVGLGAAAVAETPELRALVLALAEESIAANTVPSSAARSIHATR